MKKKANDKTREYSCLMVSVPQDVHDMILKWSYSALPDSVIYDEEGYGRELKTHVTVKYGLHTDNADDVLKRLPNNAIEFKLGSTDLFTTAKDYDVLIVKVDSPELVRLNEHVCNNFKCTDTHPEYIPHLTIAYLRKGSGEKFKNMQILPDSEKRKFTSVIFSDQSSNKVERKFEGV